MSQGYEESDSTRTAGWCSNLQRFAVQAPTCIQDALRAFVPDYTASQDRAWSDGIPLLQRQARQGLDEAPGAQVTTVMEYRLPLESRRADALVLGSDAIVVIELKGKETPHRADIDQVEAYARDLTAYHRECQSRKVHAVIVPTRSRAMPAFDGRVWISGPEHLQRLVARLAPCRTDAHLSCSEFLSPTAYRPLPTIVVAARELMESREVREVWKARAATEPAVDYISRVAHEASRTKTRHLLLVTGVPGAGKTLVGMRAVHARYLDDLAVERQGGKPTAPALYLSGNGPLVEVLQFALKSAGGGGRTFVRHIKDYLDAHIPAAREPQQHLLVFDEAQRAFSAGKVKELHGSWPALMVASEPQLFVTLCDRIPGWSVLVGLIGSGQEIHLGEEEGLRQWREALESSPQAERWTVHAPVSIQEIFAGSQLQQRWSMQLHLDTELRFHTASGLHSFVSDLLEPGRAQHGMLTVADSLQKNRADRLQGLKLYITRNLETGKDYLRMRYAENPQARFGLLASSRDRDLPRFGVDNEWGATKRVRLGPWYAEDESGAHSCRHLNTLVTEFGAQGLELDMALVAWGSDFLRVDGTWDNSRARKYRTGKVEVRNPYQLRVNAYRVLLTRGRDGSVVFIPSDTLWDETWRYMLDSGFEVLQ